MATGTSVSNNKEKFMTIEKIKDLAIEALEDVKGLDISVIDVQGRSTFTDMMVIVTGTSNRHVKSLSESVQRAAKDNGYKVVGVEGDGEAEWILVDLADVVVHVMLKTVRDFYNLEKLWGEDSVSSKTSVHS